MQIKTNMAEKVVNDNGKVGANKDGYHTLHYIHKFTFLFFFLFTNANWSIELLIYITLEIDAS